MIGYSHKDVGAFQLVIAQVCAQQALSPQSSVLWPGMYGLQMQRV